METSAAAPWLSFLDPSVFIDQWDLDSLDHELVTQNNLDDINLTNTSITTAAAAAAMPPMSEYSSPIAGHSLSCKLLTESGSSSGSSFPTILCFGNPDSPSAHVDDIINVTKALSSTYTTTTNSKKRSYELTVVSPAAAAVTRPASHNQEHVMAERTRREKLTQKFIALSAIVPGLKKMDKATVLENAIEYLKQLEEQVKNLEEQAAKRLALESSAAAIVKRADDANYSCSSCDENFNDQVLDKHYSTPPEDLISLPQVKVRLLDKSVLVNIHCESRKGVLVKALAEIESLHLTVLNTSVIPFSGSSLDITVMARMEEGFSMTVEDLVKKVNSAVRGGSSCLAS